MKRTTWMNNDNSIIENRAAVYISTAFDDPRTVGR